MTTALTSWRDGPAKQAIVDFVTSATQDGPRFTPAADRIATFDNDGTLWVEQPMPPQFDFVFRKWAAEAEADPSLAAQQPHKALIEKDEAFFEGVATQDPKVVATLQKALIRSWVGTTPDEFDAQVDEWVKTVKQPKLGDGKIVRSDQLLGGLDLGPGKREHIFAQTGRLPAFAGGNADVDIEMLTCAKFALLVNHDDADREFAYTKAAEKSLATAEQLGWTVVSVKSDWTTVFKKQGGA